MLHVCMYVCNLMTDNFQSIFYETYDYGMYSSNYCYVRVAVFKSFGMGD